MDRTIPPRARRRAAEVVATVVLGCITVLAAATTTTASTTEPPPSSDVTPATEPPATEPPTTEPPATEPPATEPPATEPPATEPPATEPPAMEPPTTEALTTAVVGEVATVEVLEEIPVIAAAEDDFGESNLYLSASTWTPAYGEPHVVSARVADFSTSCSLFGDCNNPGGTVEFVVDGSVVATRALQPVAGSASSSEVTSNVPLQLDAGTHVVEARYVPGDFDSSSSSATISVAKADCAASFSQLSERTTIGDNPIFVSHITGPSQSGPPSGGTITVRDQNGNVVREVTKPGFSDSFIGINSLAVGTHTLTFTYSGDSNHNACSSSNSVTHHVYRDVDANDDNFSVDQGQGYFADILANDTGADGGIGVTITEISDPAHGSAELDGFYIRYQPDDAFTGTDTFTYTVVNGAGQGDTATVTFDVRAPIVAVDDAVTTSQDDQVTVDVLANDTAPDPNSYVVLASEPANGVAVVNDDDTVTYTPDPGYTGTDTFDYQVFDNIRPAATATVTVVVEPDPPAPTTPSSTTSTTTTTTTTTVPTAPSEPARNGSPVVGADSYSVTAGQTLLVGAPGLLANDSDPDGDQLTAQLAADAAHGTLVVNPDGSFAYTPDAGFVGTDSFSYAASDGEAQALGFAGQSRMRPAAVSDPMAVTITVNPAPAPAAAVIPAGQLPATR